MTLSPFNPCIYYHDLMICLDPTHPDAGKCEEAEVKDKDQLQDLVTRFLDGQITHDILIEGYDAEDLSLDFLGLFGFIPAAGGLVRNEAGEWLFIERFGMWDLPKGKLHRGEVPAKCAVREVSEETGIRNLSVVKELPRSYHIYPNRTNFILKETRWFSMMAKGDEKPVPQAEEDITRAEWLKPKAAKEALAGSYRSLRETLSAAVNDSSD